jgi:multiple antibiotic resistance protein
MELIDIALIAQMFVLINPFSSFSVLFTAYQNRMNVKKIAVTASILAFVIAVVICLVGSSLFGFFGITIDSFRIAGGICLLLLGLDTIRDKKEKENVGKVDSLISILATPLLTGPATISFIIIKSLEIGRVTLLSNIVITFILVGIIFILFSYGVKKINLRVIQISAKILGLFLTAMAIELIFTGAFNLFSLTA